jgi:uncharacterized protein YcbK (DUF882 family)
MPKWTYFSEKEVVGLLPDLVFKLERAREYYGMPIVITSGFRNPEKNEVVGGVKDSAHTKGMAVDIAAPQDRKFREKLCWALGSAGFRRIGIYERHIHIDVDIEKPMNVAWFGEYKATA